jgi:glycosyltransferase involved in cell wall biosynthesis
MTLKADPSLRVALVHDWLTGMRGGEKVLEQLCRLFPRADLLTLVHLPGSVSPIIERRRIITSGLDRLPGIGRCYRHLLPLLPAAIEAMDVSGYDLVFSTSHCVAKGIGGKGIDQPHVCYCHSPMRYVWSVADDYDRRMGPSGWALKALRPWLRAWDRRTAARVDTFIANSRCVARRIARAYGRRARVVHPPVAVDFYTPSDAPREDFYLVLSALAPYKKVDHAVRAFAHLPDKRLKIIGTGQMDRHLRAQAPPNVQFLGWQGARSVRDHLRRCRAVLFPPLEDFGIVPVEAAACGAPVIAYAAGGALETVRDAATPGPHAPTGLLYRPQSVEGLVDAIRRFEALDGRFDPSAMHAWATRFGPERFLRQIVDIVAPLPAQRGLAGFVAE